MMLKAIWFVVKLGLFIGAVLWIAERPGSVQIEWLEYTITVHIGLFFAALVAVVLLGIFLYRVIKTFVDFPASYRYYRSVKDKDKGYRALTAGLTAVAAGDTKAAMREAKKARGLLPEEHGLPLLLAAQAARLDGREEDAKEHFVALLEHKDASFLGLRGLMQSSMERGDYVEALRLAKRALALHPKQGWILKIVYDLHIRLRAWNDAEDLLPRLVKSGAMDKDSAQSERVAMTLAVALEAIEEGLDDVAQSQFAKARRLDKEFVPNVLLEARFQHDKGRDKQAASLIERRWKAAPHPAMLKPWFSVIPEKQDKDALSRLRWMERLLKANAESAAAQLAAGRIAMEAGLWGEARAHLARAEELGPSASLYKALAELEERSGENYEGARQWMGKAADALGDEVWLCRETGRIYDVWAPIAEPHGAFNTIEWALPGDLQMPQTISVSVEDAALIEAPRVA